MDFNVFPISKRKWIEGERERGAERERDRT